MKYIRNMFFIVACFVHNSTIYPNEIISFFIRHLPAIENKSDTQRYIHSFSKPGKIAEHSLEHIHKDNPLTGIFCLYGGYLTFSNTVGQVTLPRKQESSFIHLIVTTQITPMIMAYNTIDHWEIEIGTPTSMFLLERKEDPETNFTYWDVKKEALPADNRIPLESIILFAKPQHIVIPEGITLTSSSANLILPDIYLKKGSNPASQALYVLNLRHFFGKVIPLYKKEPTRYMEHTQ